MRRLSFTACRRFLPVAALSGFLLGHPGPAAAGPAEDLALYLKLFPSTRSIGIIYSDPRNEAPVAALRSAAETLKLKLLPVKVASLQQFPQALRGLQPQVDTVWVLDDPLYANLDAWKYFIMFSLRYQLKTVVPNRRAVELGGLCCFPESGKALINKKVLGLLGLEPGPQAAEVSYYGG